MHVVPPGGFSGQVCGRYTARQKLSILVRLRRLQAEEGLNLSHAAARLGSANRPTNGLLSYNPADRPGRYGANTRPMTAFSGFG